MCTATFCEVRNLVYLRNLKQLRKYEDDISSRVVPIRGTWVSVLVDDEDGIFGAFKSVVFCHVFVYYLS
jgi:hypothetical protein